MTAMSLDVLQSNLLRCFFATLLEEQTMTRFITIFCFAFAALFTSSVNAQFADNFDSYDTGFDVHGTNGWKGWDNDPAASAVTSAAQALSTPNSIAIAPTSDLINEMGNPTSGKWEFTVDQYIPVGHTGDTFFIMQNTYSDGGTKNWSIELLFSGATGLVTDDFDPGWAGVPYILDQWVPIRVVVDLDADTVEQYYNGVLIPNTFGATGESWSLRSANGGGTGNGAQAIGALDLFSNGGSTIFYDNVELKALALGDANGDGEFNNLDIASFVLALTNPVAYQAMFPDVDTDCVLDMNGDGIFSNLDIASFVAALTGGGGKK
jgi:hypothetical protein